MDNSFWFGYKLENFLFANFDIESPLGLVAICLGTAMVVVLFESLKTTRIINKMKSNNSDGRSLFKLAFSTSLEKSTLIEKPENIREIWRISDIFFHLVELVLGYLLMLIAMTYNGYIFISICLGAGVAYLIFGSVLLNVTAQMVVKRLCLGCHMKPNGSSTPVVEADEDGACSSGYQNDDSATAATSEEKFTTVQVHL